DLKVNKIQRIFGGEYGVILQQDRVWRMLFVGAPVVFQFGDVLSGVGLIAPGAAVQDGETIYFLSTKGFFALESGTQATPIGDGRVDNFVRNDLDQSNLHRMSATADTNSKRVFWAYPGAGNTSGRPNRILVYDRTRDRWAIMDQDVELLWTAGGSSIDLDAAASTGEPLDIDDPDADISFDDPRWMGGAPFLAAFDSTFASGSFSGSVREAMFKTKEYALADGARTQLNGFRSLVQGGSVTAYVGTRNSLFENVSFSDAL